MRQQMCQEVTNCRHRCVNSWPISATDVSRGDQSATQMSRVDQSSPQMCQEVTNLPHRCVNSWPISATDVSIGDQSAPQMCQVVTNLHHRYVNRWLISTTDVSLVSDPFSTTHLPLYLVTRVELKSFTSSYQPTALPAQSSWSNGRKQT